jgi:chromosome segregation ATPase
MKKDLDDQIIQIKKEKKELRTEVAKAREAIDEGKKQTAELKAENKKLFRFRAEMKSDFREFREKDFADFNGRIEEINKRVEDLQAGVEAENHQIGARIQEVETQVQTQQGGLSAQEAKTASLIQQVDQDGTSYAQKMGEFQTALTTFKASLADLGDKFVQEAERDTRVETELSQQMGQNTQLSQAALDEMQTRLATNTANIDEVSQSVTSIKQALGQSGSLLGNRLDEEADRVAVLESKQSQLETDFLAAKEQFNTDTQALKTSTGTLQGDLGGFETQLMTQSNEIQELRQTALQLKEHQELMGNLLGQRGDDLIQQAGRLDERMKLVESHQTSLDQTMETNRQNTTRHLDELTVSLTSMSQALQKTTGDLAVQLTAQEQALNDLTQQIQALQVVKGEVKSDQSQLHNRLAELENHQLAVATKIDSDVQTINTHLKEVNSAIASENKALAQVNTQLNKRIDQQEQHLNKALAGSQSVDGLKKTTRDNRSHLNQLTETVNKLREVLTTIGKKFGERVDQHEARIAELAKRLNQLQAQKVKK